MTVEHIIQRIKHDADQEIKQIKMEANQQKQRQIKHAKQQAEQQATTIITQGKQQAENLKKILISQAAQDIKRQYMTTREQLIETCFTQAHQQLGQLKGTTYETFLKQALKHGSQRIPDESHVFVTRKTDESFITQQGFTVAGIKPGTGGIILQSTDGRITIDHTFDGIIKRKKNEIRIQVGKLLFSK